MNRIVWVSIFSVTLSASIATGQKTLSDDTSILNPITAQIKNYKDKNGYYPVTLENLVTGKYVTLPEEKEYISDFKQSKFQYNPLTGKISPKTDAAASQPVAGELNPVAAYHFNRYAEIFQSKEYKTRESNFSELISCYPNLIVPQLVNYFSNMTFEELMTIRPVDMLDCSGVSKKSFLRGLINFLENNTSWPSNEKEKKLLGTFLYFMDPNGSMLEYEYYLMWYYIYKGDFPGRFVTILYQRNFRTAATMLAGAICKSEKSLHKTDEKRQTQKDIHDIENFNWYDHNGYELDSESLQRRDEILKRLSKSEFWWARLYCAYEIHWLSLSRHDLYKNLCQSLANDPNPYVRDSIRQLDEPERIQKERFLKQWNEIKEREAKEKLQKKVKPQTP